LFPTATFDYDELLLALLGTLTYDGFVMSMVLDTMYMEALVSFSMGDNGKVGWRYNRV
jgi:hypothetical protein